MGRMRAFDDPNHENVTLIADAAAARVNGTLEGEKKERERITTEKARNASQTRAKVGLIRRSWFGNS